MTGEVRVGTSGWQYADWRGTVYPEGLGPSRWLSEYVSLFPTVEVNATFYRLARQAAVEKWRETAPPGFEFCLKGSQFITHRLKLRESGGAVGRFFAPLKSLMVATAVVLWQLPPRWSRDATRLDEFLARLPTDVDHAVEFRDDDWYHPEVERVLTRHGAAQVWLSSSITTRHTFVRTAEFLYVRFHGRGPEPYRYDYSREELEPWAERLRAATSDGTRAWVFFNNDGRGRAVANARTLIELLGESARPWVHER